MHSSEDKKEIVNSYFLSVSEATSSLVEIKFPSESAKVIGGGKCHIL